MFGDPPSQRSAEDLAYSVARFFSKNGTLVNYYMVIIASLLDSKTRRRNLTTMALYVHLQYHGGTNFGRSGSSFAMTRYYDEAPLDEFG